MRNIVKNSRSFAEQSLLTAFFRTVVGALLGKYERKFNLTLSQRTLMLQTISFMTYLLIGALIFSKVEGWHYLDAVFWADFTLLTVGLGAPLTPQTHTGRSLLIPYAIGGIVTVGLIIGSIRSMLLETGKNKLRARTTEKTRARVHSYADVKSPSQFMMPKSKKPNYEVGHSPEEARRREFHAMRNILKRADTKSKWRALLVSSSAGAVLWFIGALVFQHTEYKQGWSYFVALYFSYTSLLTIGYGDYEPYSNSGKAFFVFWSLLAVPTLTILISDMGVTIVKGIADLTNSVGALTILPSDTGFAAAWSETFANMASFFNTKSGKTNLEMEKSFKKPKQKDKDQRRDFASMLKFRLGDEDMAHCSSFSENQAQNRAQQDHSFYRWLLVKEISKALLDTQETTPKEYSYDEWKYFLRLLGHDEHKPELHRRPNPRPKRTPDEEPQLGRPIDKYGVIRPWSWIGIRSPLMSPKDEASWLLQQLLAKLQRQMDIAALKTAENAVDVPVSLDLLVGSDAASVGSQASHPEPTKGV